MTKIATTRKPVGAIKRILILLCLLVLPACSAFTTRVEIPKEVKVIVSVPCIRKADIPSLGLLSDKEMADLDRYKRTLAMWDERRARDDFEAQLLAVLTACAEK